MWGRQGAKHYGDNVEAHRYFAAVVLQFLIYNAEFCIARLRVFQFQTFRPHSISSWPLGLPALGSRYCNKLPFGVDYSNRF